MRAKIAIFCSCSLWFLSCDSLREISTDFTDKPKVTNISPADVASQVALTGR
jgi:hypothetical protein